MLSFEQVLNDALLDFQEQCIPDMNTGQFSAPFNQVLYPVVENMAEREMYCCCSCCIWEIYSRYCGYMPGVQRSAEEKAEKRYKDAITLNNLSDGEIIASLKNTVGIITDPTWSEWLEQFVWEPAVLKQVHDDSFAILMKVETYYYHLDVDTTVIEEVDSLFERIVKAKEQLESLNYIYRQKDDVMLRYEAELAVCTKDVTALKQHTLDLSQRMKDHDEFLRCMAYRILWGSNEEVGTNPYEAVEDATGNTALRTRDGYWTPETKTGWKFPKQVTT